MPTEKKKPRRPIRVNLNLRLDLAKAAGAVADLVRDLVARLRRDHPGGLVAWAEVPTGSLVMTTSGAGVARLLVRASVDSGALVGTLDDHGRPSLDDAYEHESWWALGRRRGSPEVLVLATRVRPNATADDLFALAERGIDHR